MTTPNQPAAERNLREIFRTMEAHQAQAIRDAYYKAVEGLSALAETLEFADLDLGGPHEHTDSLIGCQRGDVHSAGRHNRAANPQ